MRCSSRIANKSKISTNKKHQHNEYHKYHPLRNIIIQIPNKKRHTLSNHKYKHQQQL